MSALEAVGISTLLLIAGVGFFRAACFVQGVLHDIQQINWRIEIHRDSTSRVEDKVTRLEQRVDNLERKGA